MKNLFKRHYLSFAFALVFLPPKKEMEDWSGALPAKSLAPEAWIEKSASSSSSSASSKALSASSRFSFNGIDRLSFTQNKGSKADWELNLPPVEIHRIWETGAWSGISLSAKELHHFYTRAHRRGPEPKYRAYSFSRDWELIDFDFCSKKESFILEKSLKAKKESRTAYRLTLIKMLSSQELKRESSWDFDIEPGQEIVGLRGLSCMEIELNGWPKSYLLKLNTPK